MLRPFVGYAVDIVAKYFFLWNAPPQRFTHEYVVLVHHSIFIALRMLLTEATEH